MMSVLAASLASRWNKASNVTEKEFNQLSQDTKTIAKILENKRDLYPDETINTIASCIQKSFDDHTPLNHLENWFCRDSFHGEKKSFRGRFRQLNRLYYALKHIHKDSKQLKSIHQKIKKTLQSCNQPFLHADITNQTLKWMNTCSLLNFRATSRLHYSMAMTEIGKRISQGKLQLNTLGIKKFEIINEYFNFGNQNFLKSINFNQISITKDQLLSINKTYPNIEGFKFSRPEFDMSCLSEFTRLTDLTCSGSSYHFISADRLPFLSRLNLHYYEKLTDISGLKRQTNLKTLRLEKCSALQNIEVLSSLPLTSLEIIRCNQIDLTSLNELTTLTHLSLAECHEIKILSLEFLQELTKLKTLTIALSRQIEDLTPVQNLTALESIRIFCKRVKDLTPLSCLKRVTFIHIDTYQKLDLTPLNPLTALTGLKIYSYETEDLTPLRDANNLISLNIYMKQLLNQDFLKNLVKLQRLNIICVNIENIAFLKAMTGLKSLSLDCKNAQDLMPLAPLKHLNKLKIKNFSGYHLNALQSLSNLTALRLSYCPKINNLVPLTSLKKLQTLNLIGCRLISTVTPLLFCDKLTSITIYSCGLEEDELTRLKKYMRVYFLA